MAAWACSVPPVARARPVLAGIGTAVDIVGLGVVVGELAGRLADHTEADHTVADRCMAVHEVAFISTVPVPDYLDRGNYSCSPGSANRSPFFLDI